MKTESRLRAIIESTDDGILAVDNDGKVLEVNQRFSDLWHIPQHLIDSKDDRAMLDFALSQLANPDAFLKKVQSLGHSDAVNMDTLAFRDGRLFEGHSRPMIMDGARVGRVWCFRDITDRKRTERRQALSSEVLGILDSLLSLPEMLNDILSAIRRETGFDAVGIRVKSGDDFPYVAHQGFSHDFLLTENTLAEHGPNGGLSLDKDGNANLECFCGLVLSGKTDPANPLFTPAGSFWTNNSFHLTELSADQDLRLHPRNRCIHAGYGSVALIPIRDSRSIVGLLQFNNRKVDSLTIDMIHFFEGISASIGAALTQERMTSALRRSESRWQELIDLAVDGILLSSHDGIVTEANACMCRMVGMEKKDLIGKQVSLLPFSPESLRKSPLRFDLLQQGQLVVSERTLISQDGTETSVEIRSKMMPDGTYQSIYRDITGRNQAEKVLCDEQKRMRTILDTVGDPIFVKDSDFRFVLANRAFYNLLGLEENAVIGKTLADNLPADEMRHFFEIDQRVIDTGIPDLREEALTVGDGITLTIFTRKARFIDDSGKRFVVGAIHNLTERKKAEEREKELRVKLERGTRMESLGVLAGGVAHDLNNILAPIVALPDMVIEHLEQFGDPANPQHSNTLDSLRMMKASALRAAGVVSDLVVMGRRGQFLKEPVNVNHVVEQVLDSKQIRTIQASQTNVQVLKQLSSGSLWCLGSESRLVRILTNLTSNAMEAIDGLGSVTIRTGQQVLAKPHYGYELVPAGNYVTLEVMDTGCGMDTQTLARIFEPFFSTKSPTERSGSGLGLSVVHGLVRDHEGFLNVESVPGKGTTFTVYLPEGGTVREAPGLSPPSTLPGGSERILVVDDEPGLRLLAERNLKNIGYKTEVVSSGEEAVTLFEETGRRGKPAPFDLVLIDMIMKGLNGLATCRAILGLYPEQKVMIMSGYAPDEYEEQIRAMGVEWLGKPFTPIKLALAIRSRLDR